MALNPLDNRRRIEEVAAGFDARVPAPPAAGTLLVADGAGGYEPVRVIRFNDGDEVVYNDDEYVELKG